MRVSYVGLNEKLSKGVYIGRLFFTFALLALIGAWITQLNDGRIFGMSQQHLFNEAMVLALLGIGSFLEAFWHSRAECNERASAAISLYTQEELLCDEL